MWTGSWGQVLPIPEDQWLPRLRACHRIWLVKEKEYAEVQWAYEPPNPGSMSGRLGIVRFHNAGHYEQTWYTDGFGRGIDDSQLFAPVQGNLPDEVRPISEPWQRWVERRIDRLFTDMDQLKTAMNMLMQAILTKNEASK